MLLIGGKNVALCPTYCPCSQLMHHMLFSRSSGTEHDMENEKLHNKTPVRRLQLIREKG